MKTLISMCSRTVLSVLALSVIAVAPAALAATPGVDPQSVVQTVNAGNCVTITNTVHTPPIPPKPDIVFLADNTGSMGPTIANVQANAAAILTTVDAADPEAQFAVASYTDFNCTNNPNPYLLLQGITANNAAVISAINSWTAIGGCDTPEAQLNALYELATTGAGYRSGSTKIVVWFGDSNGHDPSNGHTLADVINALVAADIRVIAIPVVSGFGNGLNTPVNGHQQASEIVMATGGVLLSNATPDEVSDAILVGLVNLPVSVSARTSTNCDPSLAISVEPTNQTVTSGMDATFLETICVSSNASQCGSLSCEVDWLLDGKLVLLTNGVPDPAFVQSLTIAVPDVTPPVVDCVPTTNPAGDKVPTAGTNPNSGENPDGFYQLLASDNCNGTNLVIFVKDSAEGPCGGNFSAGPYPSGTRVKLIQSPGKARVDPMAGVIVARIQTVGEPVLVVTDSSGNTTCHKCFLPPPPK